MENPISIFNYEAYYLDYLEGNLGAEETAYLLAFLEKHPELKLEDETLPELDTISSQLDQPFKTELKIHDENALPINFQTLERLLIAQTEGLLDEIKSKEVNTFIQQHPAWLKEQQLYAHTRFKTPFIPFADKQELKRKKAIVLWPYIAFAAAASGILFYFSINHQSPGENLPVGMQQVADNTKKTNQPDKKQPDSIENDVLNIQIPLANTADQVPAGHTTENPAKKHRIQNQEQPGTESIPTIQEATHHVNMAQVQKNPVNEPEHQRISQDPLENNQSSTVYQPVSPENNQASNTGYYTMHNPIKPITNRLGELIHEEVDFQTTGKNENGKKGFYLKIGKFEVSRKHGK